MCVCGHCALAPTPCIPPTPQAADIGAARKYQAAPCLGFRRRARWLATMFTPRCYVWVFGAGRAGSSRFLRQNAMFVFCAGRAGSRLMMLPSASGRLLLLPGASWRLLVLPGASWRFLALPGASWCFLVFLGTSCCVGAPACARVYARCYFWVLGAGRAGLRRCVRQAAMFGFSAQGALARASWCFLVLPGASWCFLAPPGSFWRFLAPPGASGHFLAPPCASRRLLVLPGACWRLLMVPGASWCCLAPPLMVSSAR